MKEDHIEIKNSITDSIYDILGDVSPYLSTETKNKLSKEFAEQTLNNCMAHLNRILSENDTTIFVLEKEAVKLANEIADLEDTIKKLRDEIHSLDEAIAVMHEKEEDLMLKINNPTAWAGKKFGI